MKQDLLAGFERVVFIGTDQKAWQKVRRVLDDARLLIPSRVRVVLRDRFSEDDLHFAA